MSLASECRWQGCKSDRVIWQIYCEEHLAINPSSDSEDKPALKAVAETFYNCPICGKELPTTAKCNPEAHVGLVATRDKPNDELRELHTNLATDISNILYSGCGYSMKPDFTLEDQKEMDAVNLKIQALIKAQEERAVLEAIEARTPVTIMGKALEEVVVILSALELERIADMKMTMGKLDEWMKLVREDHHKAVQKALDRTMEDTFKRLQSNQESKQ